LGVNFNPNNNKDNLFSLFSSNSNPLTNSIAQAANFYKEESFVPQPKLGEIGNVSTLLENGKIIDINLIEFTQIEALGHFLYTYGSIFLIILSLILLLAMLAIIIISKKNITNI
jgi:hypothetical protein